MSLRLAGADKPSQWTSAPQKLLRKLLRNTCVRNRPLLIGAISSAKISLQTPTKIPQDSPLHVSLTAFSFTALSKLYMDANALLRKQGWKGSGHSLDTTGRGIKKPLLIAHKQDQLGLGEKKAAWKTDDHWWMRAFDESLQNIGTGQKVSHCIGL
jgi:hypothetical protein